MSSRTVASGADAGGGDSLKKNRVQSKAAIPAGGVEVLGCGAGSAKRKAGPRYVFPAPARETVTCGGGGALPAA